MAERNLSVDQFMMETARTYGISRDVGSNGKSGSPDCVRTAVHGRSYLHGFNRKIDTGKSEPGQPRCASRSGA